jgi:hypothetical protein
LRRQLKASGNLHPGSRKFHPSRSTCLSSTNYAICLNEVSIKVCKFLLGAYVLNHSSLLVGTSEDRSKSQKRHRFFSKTSCEETRILKKPRSTRAVWSVRIPSAFHSKSNF